MILSILLAVVAFAALLPVVLPLLTRTGAVADRSAFDQAVYRDQLRELDRDIARGVLTEAEAQGSRLEIQRRLLASDAAAGTQPAQPRHAAPVLALIVAVIIGGGSVGVYSLLSPPARQVVADAPSDDRARGELAGLIGRLKERLAAEPDSMEGWQLYARAMAGLGNWDESLSAYRRLMELGDGSADTLASYGEVLTARAQGVVPPAARQAFEAALAKDPGQTMSRFYLAVATGQAGERAKAIEALQAIAAEIPDDSSEREEIGRRIAEFATAAGIPVPKLTAGRPAAPAPGPDEDTVAGAQNLPAAEREAMVRAMVARLAERLQREPDDLDGWMRLGRSWSVLNEAGKSADAYERAAALRPNDVSIPLRAVESLLKGLAVTDPLPSRAVTILRQIEAVRPDEPAVLWYLGLVAARDGDRDRTRLYWQRLLGQLPPNGQEAGMVKAALDALDRK